MLFSILITLLSIIITYFLCKIYRSEKIYIFLVGITFFALSFPIVLISSSILISKGHYTIIQNKTRIYSLALENRTEESFIWGSGGSNTYLYYVFLVKTKDGYKIKRLRRDHVYIKTTDSEPFLLKEEIIPTSKLFMMIRTKYTFYIPKESIFLNKKYSLTVKN